MKLCYATHKCERALRTQRLGAEPPAVAGQQGFGDGFTDAATIFYSFFSKKYPRNSISVNVFYVHFDLTLKKLCGMYKVIQKLFVSYCGFALTLLASLHDQNKSGFFEGPAFNQPIRAIYNLFKELRLAGKKPALEKSHFCFDHLNRLFNTNPRIE